ncbi:ABC-type Fe3+ transport, permease component [Pyrodictium delaneyi]|uniref:ABC-type Fe3+ transport, permease component n=1 Tax=Pyrodictium delaneyi TaxID=1273541 RepID=A0A0P0N2Z8_9CREN|nr:iron ABC transporter permease [Pyrodictium delaneyi]ALL00658.1 ABC-type Fe3+ transport, permease component [Pyrodictium delaneyi]OWJ54108.1 hypothetical protein Pdsh_09640 [Pyrodictium delaneyi]
MAANTSPSLKRIVSRIAPRAKTDIEIVLLLYIPLFAILFGFVAPLFIVVVEASKMDFSELTSSYYINLDKDAFADFITVRNLPNIVRISVNGFDLGVIGNSVVNALLVTFIAALIGSASAILIGFYRFPGRRLFAILAYIPLLIAPFVNAYVMQRYFGKSFTLNTFSYILSEITRPLIGKDVMIEFSGQAGVALAQILMFYPIVYINTMAALGAIDATLVEQAINLGARGWKLIKDIILPLVMPGVLAGSTLVFILSLEDVGAPIIFRFHKVMAYQIYQYFQSVGSEASRPAVAALSFLMLVFATLPLIVVRRYLSLRYYARLARGAPRPFRGLQLGRKGLLSAYLVVLPIIVTAAAPQIGVIILAFSKKWIGPLPEPLPMDSFFANFITLSEMEGVMRSIYNSLTYVAQALVFIAIIGFMAGYATARARLPGASVLDILSSLPLAVPGLVVAFSYYVFFTTYFHGTFLDPVLFPAHVLVLAYIMRKLPFTVRSVFTAVIQTPEELEEAARSLGARRARVIRRIVLPLVWRGIIAGLLLSAIYVLSEVSVSITLGSLRGSIISPDHIGPITFAILQLTTQATVVAGGTQPHAKAAALAVILMAIEAAVITIASRLARRGQALVTV